MRSPFVLPESVRFSQYAEFNVGTETVLAELGYRFARDSIALPTVAVSDIPSDRRASLRGQIETAIRVVGFNSEMARREFLMAPIVLEAARCAGADLASEHPFDVSPRLHGSLDYLLRKENALVVIEAKNADLSRGFTQLSAEMVALDMYASAEASSLYGAVSVGDVWRFGVLDRAGKTITQDVSQFVVPDSMDDLLAILVGILLNSPTVYKRAG